MITGLGEEFGLHQVTVWQNLSALLIQGDVLPKEKLNQNQPQNIYSLATKEISELFLGGYSGFAIGLLDSVIAVDGEQKPRNLLQR